MALTKNRRRLPLRRFATLAAGLAGASLALGCTGTTATVTTTSDLYAYDYYYPADVAYYGTYWVDTWYVDPFYYAPIRQAQTYPADAGISADAGTSADGGAAADGGSASQGVTGVGTALRALARGDSVCPGQVTVVPRSAPLCRFMGGPGSVRNGATVTFNGCMLSGGGRIDGMVDYNGTLTASDQNCDANTTINVTFTATYTNLSYTAPSGARVVIPSQTDQGTYMRMSTAGPNALSITTNGTLQRYDSSNALVSNHKHSGTRTYMISRPNDVLTYVVNGTLMVQDLAGGSATTIMGNGITRTASCCRPTSGTLTVATTGNNKNNNRTANWTFGPSCGQATLNGSSTTFPACE
jgi:hypothetical protein